MTEYFAHTQTVCTRPLLASRPGNEASTSGYIQFHAINHISLEYAGGGGGGGHQK